MANMEGVSSIWRDHGIFLLEGSNLYYTWLYKQLSHHKNVLGKLVIIIWDPGSNSWVSRAESSGPWNSKGAVASEGVSLHCPTTSEVLDYQKTRRYQSVKFKSSISSVCASLCAAMSSTATVSATTGPVLMVQFSQGMYQTAV